MNKITKNSRITIIELPPTQFGKYNGNAGYDIYSLFRMPARAAHVLEALLKKDSWTNVKSLNPFYQGEKDKFTPENEQRIFSSDVLCLSAISRTFPQTMWLGREAKKRNPNLIVIAGGFDPTSRSEKWLSSGACDIVVRKEGEKTFPELMQKLTLSKNPNLKNIKGISYINSKGKIIHNPDRELLTSEELSEVPHPFYDSQVKSKVMTVPLETSRGCPNDCAYCGVTEFYGRRYRTKSIKYVLEELKNIQNMGKFIFITDDNFTANPTRTIELLNAIEDSGIKHKWMGAQVTVKIAENPELLKALKKSRVEKLFVGIESINDETLKHLGKPYSAKQNMDNIKKLRDAGFWVHGMLMAGGDYDTPESLKKMNEWANNNLDSMQIFAITPVPGTKYWGEMEKQGRILTKDFSLFDGMNVVCKPNPKHFTPFELQEAINNFNINFYSPKNILKRILRSRKGSFKANLVVGLYVGKLKKRILYNPQAIKHREFLRSISKKK